MPDVLNAFGMVMPERSFSIEKYRYGFGGHEKDSEVSGEGNHLVFGDYGYDTRLGRRWNRDPMTVKYPYESPYIVFGDNPIIFIDPDGKEKIIALDNKKEGDKDIIAGANKYEDDGAIHIFGHGNTKGMYLVVGGKKVTIENAKQLEGFLSENSETWKNKKDGDKPVIVLHSCNTGRDQKDGSSSFAQKISESEVFKDVTVIAPNERDYFDANGEVGTYKAKHADANGAYKTNDNGEVKSKARSETPGSWRIFKNGEQTGQYRGDWKAKEEPTMWDNMTKKEEVKQ
jgi:hypothetical protein